MAEAENKPNEQANPEVKPAAEAAKPAAAAPATAVAPAAAAPKAPAAPPKPNVLVATAWEGEIPARLLRSYGTGVEPLSTLGQNFVKVDRTLVHGVLRILREEYKFDYLVDCTAVHFPKNERPFEVVWIVYNHATHERVRVKAAFADGEAVPTVTDLWSTANWMEREIFDLFGIRFTGHPNMKRILLPDEWSGHPLRKDYPVNQQDSDWVKSNIGIESAQ